MSGKSVRYIITVSVIMLIAYNSIYFKKLDEVKAARVSLEFNPQEYAQAFWKSKLIPKLNTSIDWVLLDKQLTSNPEEAFKTYSHALGIGNLRYFLVSGEGEIESLDEDQITIRIEDESGKYIATIATEYIFGNAVRDATGLININEFVNTMDFNNVSAELNAIVRKEVLPTFKQLARKGDKVKFFGAIELNKEHPKLSEAEVIPIDFKIRK